MRCLDWTPVSLRTCPNFDRISGETVEITTIETINFLDNIEIIKKSSLVDKIVPPSYDRNSIYRETNPLVESDNYIEQ